MAGAVVAWAVPAMEVLSAKVAAAGSPAPPPSGGTNISWVMLVFQDTSVVDADVDTSTTDSDGDTSSTDSDGGRWYLWSSGAGTGGGFTSTLTGIGNVPPENFSYFAFYNEVGGSALDGFATPGPGTLAVAYSFDSSGDMDLNLSGSAPSSVRLQYVIVHGGANPYNGSTGSIVASDGSGSYASGDSPTELDLPVPTSVVVADSLQYFDTPIEGGTKYTLGYVVGNT